MVNIQKNLTLVGLFFLILALATVMCGKVPIKKRVKLFSNLLSPKLTYPILCAFWREGWIRRLLKTLSDGFLLHMSMTLDFSFGFYFIFQKSCCAIKSSCRHASYKYFLIVIHEYPCALDTHLYLYFRVVPFLFWFMRWHSRNLNIRYLIFDSKFTEMAVLTIITSYVQFLSWK